MDYIELTCKIESEQLSLVREILMHELANIGYESFVDTDTGMLAYIANRDFDTKELEKLTAIADLQLGKVLFKWELIKDQNWNQEWENNFNPVIISGRCYIRATFHTPNPDIPYEIIIEPKMSFGTGHHETTSLMIEEMLKVPFKEKQVLDMGCGTAILSVMASKLGCKSVMAIDIDDWAYRNAIENIGLNDVQNVQVVLGDKFSIPNTLYDIVLANINRNILLDDIPTYSKCLNINGILILSGIFVSDLQIITETSEKYNLSIISSSEKNNWCSAVFRKK